MKCIYCPGVWLHGHLCGLLGGAGPKPLETRHGIYDSVSQKVSSALKPGVDAQAGGSGALPHPALALSAG